MFKNLYAGDTCKFSYESSEAGTIAFYFSNASTAFNAVAAEKFGKRNFKTKLPNSHGLFSFQAVVTDVAGDKKTLLAGQMEILESISDGRKVENKLIQEKILENIETYLLEPNSIKAKKSEYDGKSLERYNLEELQKIRAYLKSEIKLIRSKELQKSGIKTNGGMVTLKA